jgi:F-type H+-transporting ATPase subunit epsilon
MASFNFELVSPEKMLFSGPVESVIVPSADGEMTVFAGHAPVMAMLKPGIISVSDGKNAARRVFVRGGFADISGGAVTILAEQALAVEDLTQAILDKEIEVAEAAGSVDAVAMLRQLRNKSMN